MKLLSVRLRAALRCILLIALLLAGCSPSLPPAFDAAELPTEQAVAPGVVFRSLEAGGGRVCVLDADLRAPGVRARVVAENPGLDRGRVFADARTVRDWCVRVGALGGVNGGFFGETEGGRKEVVGLLATGGALRASGRIVRSSGTPHVRRVRSVLAFDAQGMPRIGWIVGARGRAAQLTEYAAPLNPQKAGYWRAESAVACGPRLIQAGRKHVADREERLASPPPLPRTFVGYSVERGRPRRLVLAVAEAMTYHDAADFLADYFRRHYGAACAEAMCLDGGASSQLVFREAGSGYRDARFSPVGVPTAVLLTGPGPEQANAPPPH